MTRFTPAGRALLLATLPVLLTGCWWDGHTAPVAAPTPVSLGGSITGLGSAGLVLANGTDTVSPASGAGSFTFGSTLAPDAAYAVTVRTQPGGATCTVANGSGTAGSTAITNVQVSCGASRFPVGGTISGLASAGLVLANGADTVSPASGATSFSFTQQVAGGASYAVSVQTQPANATCTLANASGTVATAAVTNVQLTCTANTYRVGGTISGLTASGLVLANGSDTLSPPSGATSFTFATRVATGGAYSVTVSQQPTGLTCAVAGTFPATVGTADVTSVAVSCSGANAPVTVAGNQACPASSAPNYYADGSGSAANIPDTESMATDAAGNVYAIGQFSRVLRKVSPTGVVTTLAGQAGVNGTADGTGSAAAFYGPMSVATDAAGNAYVGDLVGVRKVTPAGVVTTLAGNANCIGTPYVNGTGAAACLGIPQGIAVDSHGNVFVANRANDVIQKVTPAGVVTTFAGSGGAVAPGSLTGFVDGVGTAAEFNMPWSLAIDAADNVYVGDNNNNAIRKITPAGAVTTLAGGGPTSQGYADGTGSAALFNAPLSLGFFGSTLYVLDQGFSIVRAVSPSGVVTTLANALNSGTVALPGSQFAFPGPSRAMTVGQTGKIFIGGGCRVESFGP